MLAKDPAVGIWHDLRDRSPGHYEVVYANMTPFGLGKALGTQPVGTGRTAAQRMRASHATA